MKINLLIAGLFILVNLTSSCNSKKESDSSSDGANASGSVRAATLPCLSPQEVNILYSRAEQVDIIFYNLPISVNQDDAASAKNTVLYVAPAGPVLTSKCEPLGRLSWISDGKIFREADFYIGQGCNHFVFMENGQPAFKNAMSPEGVQFFQTIMSQVKPPDKK